MKYTDRDGIVTEEALQRLPKWAQQRIRNLERDRETAWDKLRGMCEPTRIGQGYDPRSSNAGQPRRWLPQEHVTFYAPDEHRELDRFIEVQHDPETGHLRIRGSERISVWPNVTNTIVVKLEKQ